LSRLGGEARAAELSPQLVTSLGRVLSMSGGDAIPLLRKAQAHHPDDFWLNALLAWALGNAKQWDGVVTKMIKVFGAPVSDQDAKTIVEYLATQYGN